MIVHLAGEAAGSSLVACDTSCAATVVYHLGDTPHTVDVGFPTAWNHCLHCAGCGARVHRPDRCKVHPQYGTCPPFVFMDTVVVASVIEKLTDLFGPLNDAEWDAFAHVVSATHNRYRRLNEFALYERGCKLLM